MTPKAGPEMDAMVAEKCMGLPIYNASEPHTNAPHILLYAGKVLRHTPYEPYIGPSYTGFSPSTDIAAAMDVLDHVVGCAYYEMDNGYGEVNGKRASGHYCKVVIPGGEGEAFTSTRELSICVACLKALGAIK